jgi:hypothetical protein
MLYMGQKWNDPYQYGWLFMQSAHQVWTCRLRWDQRLILSVIGLAIVNPVNLFYISKYVEN